jgi:hypothetical protein
VAEGRGQFGDRVGRGSLLLGAVTRRVLKAVAGDTSVYVCVCV